MFRQVDGVGREKLPGDRWIPSERTTRDALRKDDQMRFRATLELNGKSATGLQVPDDVVADLGGGRRPAVRVTINGHTYRSTVASMGGRYMLPVSAKNRTDAGIAAGDEIDVEITLDTEPREVSVPPDVAEALDSDADVKRVFDGLSFSNRRGYVDWIEAAKKDETRRRRIADMVVRLREGRVRP